jgi:hypothetical protein
MASVKQAESTLPETLGAMEPHYSVEEIAETWHLSRDAVRRIFDGEPGVLVIENRGAFRKRRYRTFRIPAPVVERVHRRLLTKTVPIVRVSP